MVGMATTVVNKLKAKEIAAHRAMSVLEQNGICPLCEQPLALKDAVLDHRHKDGLIRQAIHRFCNTFLGKIENGIVRNRITPVQLQAILKNYEQYVNNTKPLLHPTFLTPEQRAERTKKRARARRAKK